MAGAQGNVKFQYEEVVSYLPLSHVAAQVLDIFIPILYAGTVYFAQPDALRVRRQRPIPLPILISTTGVCFLKRFEAVFQLNLNCFEMKI